MPLPELIAKDILGIRVQRATANLPQTAAAPIFTISGGRVLLRGIVGEVTTAIQNQANNTKLTANPTAAGATDTDICAVVDIANLGVGGLLGITGTFATAMQKGGAVNVNPIGIVLVTGTLDLNCAASNTGQVKWTAYYMPLDSTARMVAA